MKVDVYAKAEAFVREMLMARPKARGQGRSKQFIDNCVKVAMWLIRKHAAYGPRRFSIAREILARMIGLKPCNVRTALAALLDIGMLEFCPRAKARKFLSPEYAAYQAQLSLEIRGMIDPEAADLLSDSQTRQFIQELKNKDLSLPISGEFARAGISARNLFQMRQPFSAIVDNAKRETKKRLEELKRQPLPRLSPLALKLMQRR